MEGVVSVGFSPDKHPEFARRGVVAFVVFETVEQRNAALVDEKVCYALLDTGFQLANKLMRCEAKNPELNVALDRRQAGQVSAGRKHRRVESVLPKPLGKDTGAGLGGSTGSQLQGEWASRPTIADEQGRPTDRGGEETLKRMEQQANEMLVEQLGKQMEELFTSLMITLKQEEDNTEEAQGGECGHQEADAGAGAGEGEAGAEQQDGAADGCAAEADGRGWPPSSHTSLCMILWSFVARRQCMCVL